MCFDLEQPLVAVRRRSPAMATAEEITRHLDDDPDGIEWVGIDPPLRPIEVVEPDPGVARQV